MTKGKEANSCKICHTTVNHKTGLQCEGACRRWTHFRCLKYPPEKIEHIKLGAIKIMCPCADCKSKPTKNETLKLNDYGEYSIIESARTRSHREDRNMPYHPKQSKETRCFDYLRDDGRRHKEPWDYLYRGHNHSHRDGKDEVEHKDRSKYRDYATYDEYDDHYRHDLRVALVNTATSPLTSKNDCRHDRNRNLAAKSYSFGDIPYKFVQTMPDTLNASTCFACPTIISNACPKKNMSCLINSMKPCCSQPSVCSTNPCYYTPPCLSTVEELCFTIRQLTTQLNEVINKMKECKKPCPQPPPCGPPPCGPPPCGAPPCGLPPCGKPQPPPPCHCPGNPKSKGSGR